jgi:uncharacterized protein
LLSVYLDASVLLPILIEEPMSAAVDAFMLAGARELLVSDFAAAEVAAALSRLIRTGQLVASDAVARLADFEVWRAAMTSPAEIHAADIRLAYAFVRRFDLALRAPDAVHLAIAPAPRRAAGHTRSAAGDCRPRTGHCRRATGG